MPPGDGTLNCSDPTLGSSQAIGAEVTDYTAGTGMHRGYMATTNSTGDKTFPSFEGTTKATPKSGEPPDVRFEGKWSYTGGTGKFESITGGETYRGG